MDLNTLSSPVLDMSIFSMLQRREADRCPIRVGVVGAGATGRAIALQLATPVPGIRLAGIANRTAQHAERAFHEAGIRQWEVVETAREAEATISRGIPVLTTDDPHVLTRCDAIDLIVEVTGTVDFGAGVVLDAIAHSKAVVMVNAELELLGRTAPQGPSRRRGRGPDAHRWRRARRGDDFCSATSNRWACALWRPAISREWSTITGHRKRSAHSRKCTTRT